MSWKDIDIEIGNVYEQAEEYLLPGNPERIYVIRDPKAMSKRALLYEYDDGRRRPDKPSAEQMAALKQRIDDGDLELVETDHELDYLPPWRDIGEFFEDLVDAGCSPPEAVDYVMTKEYGYDQTEWAEKRDRSQQAVSENVNKARQKIRPTAEILDVDRRDSDEWEFDAHIRVRVDNPLGDDVVLTHTFRARPEYDDITSKEDEIHQYTAFWDPDARPGQGDGPFTGTDVEWRPAADLDDDEELLEECKDAAVANPAGVLDTAAERSRSFNRGGA